MLSVCFLVLASVLFTCVTQEAKRQFTVNPVGWVRKTPGSIRIVLENKYEPGLLGLNEFSHVYVFYWFDRNDNSEKRSVLRVHPRGDKQNPLRGVFATRSPVRPNLIALSLCKIAGIKGNIIEIDDIDALPDTPVLDLKPYIPQLAMENAVVPNWVHPGSQER